MFSTTWLVYALVGFLGIMFYLIGTRHALLRAVDPGFGFAGCVDWRVIKDIPTLGGAAGFTFGWVYFVLTWALPQGWLRDLLFTYGLFQMTLSTFNMIVYIFQANDYGREPIILKAHLEGCGFTTAWSPFWFLFLLQKAKMFAWVVHLRDWLTVVDFISSIPFIMFMGFVTRITFGQWIRPQLAHVDHKHN